MKKPTDRQKNLQAFFVDREDKSRIELKFLLDATSDFCSAIDFYFEQNQAHVHNTIDKLEQILLVQLRKFVDESELNNLNQDTEELSKKPTRELIDMNLDNVKMLSNKKMFVGHEVEKELKSLGLNPKSSQIQWLYEKVKLFHITAAKYLVKYFKKPLKDISMENMIGLAPSKRTHLLTPSKLKSLVLQYSKVIDNVNRFGGMDKVRGEIDEYIVDDDIISLTTSDYEKYWIDVGNLTEGAWPKYEILPRFALAMGTKNSSTSDVERGFSTLNLIHQNRQRNRMSQETLDAHLHIRSGVESANNISLCNKCDRSQISDHCHCCVAVIQEEMKSSCKQAWQKCQSAQNEKSTNKEAISIERQETLANSLLAESDRIEKVKESLKLKSNFLSASLMKPVYGGAKRDVPEDCTEKCLKKTKNLH